MENDNAIDMAFDVILFVAGIGLLATVTEMIIRAYEQMISLFIV